RHADDDFVSAGHEGSRGVEFEWIDRRAVADSDGLSIDPDFRGFIHAAAPEEDALAGKLLRDFDRLPVPCEAFIIAQALVAPRCARCADRLPVAAGDARFP